MGYFLLKCLKSGLQQALLEFRLNYCIIDVRAAICRIVMGYITCTLHCAYLKKLLIFLLHSRVMDEYGLILRTDWALPFQISPRHGRDTQPKMVYACVFVYFIAKAIYLESYKLFMWMNSASLFVFGSVLSHAEGIPRTVQWLWNFYWNAKWFTDVNLWRYWAAPCRGKHPVGAERSLCPPCQCHFRSL